MRARYSIIWVLATLLGGLMINSTIAKTLYQALELSAYPPHTAPPPLAGRTATGDAISLDSLKGKVVLLTFWASWCAECRPEMPLFEQLHQEFAKHGLIILGINVREPLPTIQQYANNLGLTFPLVLDPEGKITQSYGVVGLPTTILVHRNGSTAALAVGPRDWASQPARAVIRQLLAESASPNQ